MGNVIGSWAFLIGIILAIVLGAISTSGLDQTIIVILFVLGIIVGLLNVTDKETKPFLLAGTVLVIVSSFGAEVVSTISWLDSILGAILVLFVPATIVVALKSVFAMARN